MIELRGGNSFDLLFMELTERTCKEWGYPAPENKFYAECFARLPEGLRQTLSYGIAKEIRSSLFQVGKSNFSLPASR